MSSSIKTKERLKIAFAGGTAAGTSSIIDTSGYQYARIMTWGTTGSCTTGFWANIGTTVGTLKTTMPVVHILGSHKAAGTGIFNTTEIVGLTDQAIITHSTINGTYNTSYLLFD